MSEQIIKSMYAYCGVNSVEMYNALEDIELLPVDGDHRFRLLSEYDEEDDAVELEIILYTTHHSIEESGRLIHSKAQEICNALGLPEEHMVVEF